MNVAIIGTGARAAAYTELCLSDLREDVTVKSLVDIDHNKLQQFSDKYFAEGIMPGLYTDYKEMLEDIDVEAIFICTPDTTHSEIAVAALKKDKHILLEKPIAARIEDCVSIYRESLKHNKVFRMGFVLRYTDLYAKIKEIVANGDLGRLISIEAKEALGYIHGGSFFRRWHRLKKNNGGFLNAKCSHDMDILNWISDSEPLFVSAFGNRSYFNYREDAAERCSQCRQKHNCRYFFKTEDLDAFSSAQDQCVFNSEKDIVDHESVIIEYDNGLTASFTVSALSAEANRTMIIFGTEATLYSDFAKGTIEVRHIYPKSEILYRFSANERGHGGGDASIYTNFIDSIRTGAYSGINDARAGMMSSVISLAGEISMEQKKVINIKDTIEILSK